MISVTNLLDCDTSIWPTEPISCWPILEAKAIMYWYWACLTMACTWTTARRRRICCPCLNIPLNHLGYSIVEWTHSIVKRKRCGIESLTKSEHPSSCLICFIFEFYTKKHVWIWCELVSGTDPLAYHVSLGIEYRWGKRVKERTIYMYCASGCLIRKKIVRLYIALN